jgi:hypothetical protein
MAYKHCPDCGEALLYGEVMEAAKAYLYWHRRDKVPPESAADILNDELDADRLGDRLAAALAALEG